MKTGSSLLINESPLQVLPSLVMAVGLNEAIILQQVHYWLDINKKRKVEPVEGQQWTYNTYAQWREQFPWWSEKTIQRAVLKLEGMGLLIAASNSPHTYDHTKKYSIDYEKLERLMGSESDERPPQLDANDEDNLSPSEDTNSPDLLLTETSSETSSETLPSTSFEKMQRICEQATGRMATPGDVEVIREFAADGVVEADINAAVAWWANQGKVVTRIAQLKGAALFQKGQRVQEAQKAAPKEWHPAAVYR